MPHGEITKQKYHMTKYPKQKYMEPTYLKHKYLRPKYLTTIYQQIQKKSKSMKIWRY